MCDRVAVMYAGKVVETAPTWELFDRPAHPYAEALRNSVPDVRVGVSRLYAIEGYPPSIYEKPLGCPFAPRCAYVMPHCRREFPPEVEVAPGHRASCWRHV
jgi:oligopeptide/dipeptide ABC transporter ATP-binding protein